MERNNGYQKTLDLFPDGFFDSPVAQRKNRAGVNRAELSRLMRGLDGDIERIFLNLPDDQLVRVYARYGQQYGRGKVDYAKETYPRWKSGQTKMSGLVAERLLNLVPMVLDANTRFDLVKKLRRAFMRPETRRVTCYVAEWREHVAPVVNELGALSKQFRLPTQVVERVQWLADGDADAAHKLLAAAEREEARIAVRHLESEFLKIDALIDSVDSTEAVTHNIIMPQGTIIVTIRLPRRGFLGWLKTVIFLEPY